MVKKVDPLAYLDEPSSNEDQLSYLDSDNEDESDPLAYLDKPKEKFVPPYNLSVQPAYSDYQTPEESSVSRTKAAGQIGAGLAEGASLSAIDIMPAEDKEESYQRELGRLIGLALPVGLVGKVFRPFGIWGRLAGAGTAGAAVSTGSQYFKTGEVDPSEVAKEAAIWTGLETAIILPQMISFISKASNKSVPEVMKFLWDKVKTAIKKPFKRNPTTQDIVEGRVELEPEVEEAMTKEAEKVVEELNPKEPVKPVEPESKVVEPKEPSKPIEKIELQQPSESHQKAKEKPEIGNFEDPAYLKRSLARIENQIKEIESIKIRSADDERRLKAAKSAREDNLALQKELVDTGKIEYLEPTKEQPKSLSGYEKKPEPKTYQEKIKHLAGKIKDSQDYIAKLRPAIAHNRAELKSAENKLKAMPGEVTAIDKKVVESYRQKNLELAEAKQKQRQKIANLRSQLENKQNEVKSETKRIAELKSDLKNLKTKKEASKIIVPLGSREGKAAKKIPPHPKAARRQPIIGKAQAVKRSKILNLLRKAFKDPIRLGKIPTQMKASGIHKTWERVTRLVRDNNIETAAHEIGHNLHTLLYGGDAKNRVIQDQNVHKALRPYMDELKPIARYEPYGMEGFAEFTRMYVTNPDAALEVAPKFYTKFEADLDAQYPELKNALLEARDYYEQYLHGTPESRIRAQTDYAEDVGFVEKYVEKFQKTFNVDNLQTQLLDDVFASKRLVSEAFGIPLSEVENLKDPRNLYRALRVLKGAVGKADVFLLHETFDPITLKRVGRGLRSILRKLPDKESYKEFNDYLIARRVIEKRQQKIETGISYADAVYTERVLAPKYKRLAVLSDKYNDALLRYATKSGLLSEEQYKMIKQNNLMYTPFQRVMGKEKGGVAATSGKLQAGKPIKQMKGSTRDIIAPVESMVKNTYAIIVNAEKNLVGKVLSALSTMKGVGAYVEAVPTPTTIKAKLSREEVLAQMEKMLKKSGWFHEGGGGLGEEELKDLSVKLADIMPDFFLRFGATHYPAGENIVTVFIDGKPVYYEVSPEIYDMWSKGMAPYSADILTKILRIPARTLRAGAILNPKFMMKNVVRDTWGSWLFTKYGKEIKDPVGLFIDTLYAPLAGLVTAAKKSKLYVEWLKSGGGMSTMQSLDRDSVVKRLQEVRDGLRPTQVIQWLRKIGEITEEANRLAEFGRALKVEGETRLGKEIAVFASRDLSIDFAKMGLKTKALNQIIPFFNATVQGGDKLLRTLASEKDRGEFVTRAVGFILIPSLMLWWVNRDDEKVKELYEEEKDFNFTFSIGDTVFKIPVPFETGVMVHGLTQRMLNAMAKDDPEAFEGFMGSILSAMLPNMIPSLANPLVETAANKNFFTGAPIIPKNKEGLIAKYQYKNNSSTTARLLGRAMSYMLGQETRSKAASPAVIDHFITSWTGGLGRLMVNISDASLEAAGVMDKIPGPERSIVEKLGLDAFTTRYPRANTRSIEKFYENYQDATSRKKSISFAEKNAMEPEEELENTRQRYYKMYDYQSLQAGYKAIQMCQKEINNIWNDPTIESKIKKTLIDELYLQMIDFAKETNKSIDEHRKSS